MFDDEMSIEIVSEELSSVETTRSYNRAVEKIESFQKNLVVWKHHINCKFDAFYLIVSEELSSVETIVKIYGIIGDGKVSEELSSVETSINSLVFTTG